MSTKIIILLLFFKDSKWQIIKIIIIIIIIIIWSLYLPFKMFLGAQFSLVTQQ